MSFFSKSKAKLDKGARAVQKPQASPSETPEATNTQAAQQADQFLQVRQMVKGFNEELQESVSTQQAAIKRVSNLNKMVTRLELDLKTFRRLETDNEKLNQKVLSLDSKLAQKTTWASELDSKLTDLEKRYNEARENLEISQANLAASQDHCTAQEERLSEQDQYIRNLASRCENVEEELSQARQTLDKTKESFDVQASELAQRNRETIELRDSLEELQKQYGRKSKQGDATLVDLKNLRLDFNEVKTRHVELNGALENAKYDLKTQKNVFEETIKRRDEENLSLKTRIDQLETQVKIKENMASHLDQEFITLRNEFTNERDRCTSLELRLKQKTEELQHNSGALAKAKREYEELNDKFATMLEDFETLRRINQMQREKLERYASIGGVAVGQAVMNMDAPMPTKTRTELSEDVENITVLKAGGSNTP